MTDHEQRIEMLERLLDDTMIRLTALEQRVAEMDVRRLGQLADDLKDLRRRGFRTFG